MTRLIDGFEQFFDGAGNPLVSGELNFFESGSSTVRKTTFADSAETIANSNPVILGGDGRAPNVFGAGSYRVVLTDSDDAQVIVRDPVGGDAGTTFGADWNNSQIYGVNDVVRDGGVYWIALTSGNQDNDPTTDAGSNWRQWPSGEDLLDGTVTLDKLAADAKNTTVSTRVSFNGITSAIIGASNVSSITDTGVGSYNVNFTSGMSSLAYSVFFGGKANENIVISRFTTFIDMRTQFSSGNNADFDYVCVGIVGEF